MTPDEKLEQVYRDAYEVERVWLMAPFNPESWPITSPEELHRRCHLAALKEVMEWGMMTA